MKQVIRVKTPITTIFTASNDALVRGNLLTNLTWDNNSNADVITAQKLNGRGSYVIGFVEGERLLDVEVNTYSGRTIGPALDAAIYAHTLITIERDLYQNDGVTFTSTKLSGYITSISYNETNDNSTLLFTLKCPEPVAVAV